MNGGRGVPSSLGIREQVLQRLRLSVGEAARVSGVTVRQLSYWTDKGLVRALGAPGQRRYDYRALERIAHIRANLSEGYTLEEAAAQASARLKAKPLGDSEARQVIMDRLGELEDLLLRLRSRLSEHQLSRRELRSSARQLTELNVRAVFDEAPGTRISAEELAEALGETRDRVRGALEVLVAEGSLLRQGRIYRRK